MLPGKRDFYLYCKARRSASHVNKEFRQQFQNYAPPSLRVISTKIARTIKPRFSIEQTWECLARFARSPMRVGSLTPEFPRSDLCTFIMNHFSNACPNYANGVRNVTSSHPQTL